MLRDLTPADLDAFIAMRRESFAMAPLAFAQLPDMEIDREKTRADLAAKNEEDFILGYFTGSDRGEEQQILVGMMGFFRYPQPKRRHRGFLWGVYLREEARGKGVARQMMEETIERTRRIPGLERIILTVSHHATGAIALYRKYGFVEFGREPGAARTGDVDMDEIYMMLDLH